MNRFFWTIFLSLSTLWITSCGSDLETVTRGDLTCATEPCRMQFPPTQYPRNNSRSVIIENTGNDVLKIFEIYIEGSVEQISFSDSFTIALLSLSPAVDWQIDTETGHSFISANGSEILLEKLEGIQVELEYAPSQDPVTCDIDSCGELVIVSNDRDTPELRVPLSLIENNGQVQVSPTSIRFNDPVVGATYRGEFEIRNVGSGPLEIESVAPSSSVDGLTIENQSGNRAPFRLELNGTTTYEIEFKPTTTDPMNATIQIATSDPSSPVVSVAVRTEGGAVPTLQVTPNPIQIDETGVGSTSESLIEVMNASEGVMTWSVMMSNIVPSGSINDFSLTTAEGEPFGPSGTTLAEGNAESFLLAYTPTTDTSVQGELVFRGNFTGTEQRVSFSAGPPAAMIDAVPTVIQFGNIDEGDSDERSFIVFNNGNAALNVTGMDFDNNLSEEFSFSPTDAPFSIAAGGSRQFTVMYSRPIDDVDSIDRATIGIDSDAAIDHYTISVFAAHGGAAMAPTCVIAPTPAEPYSVGQTITLDGTQSTATDGELLNTPYQWVIMTPEGSTATLPASGDSVQFTPDITGTYVVQLVVSAFASDRTITNDCSINLFVN